MKKLFFATFLIFTFICSSNGKLYAQTHSLESVCKSLASKPNTTGDFTQTKIIQTNGRKLKSSGKYIISTLGIYWKTEKPFPSSLILTKDAMVQIAANGKKTVMSGKDNQIFANISETLSSVFSGNVEALQKNFECSFSEADGEWNIFLKPKDSTIASVMKSLLLSGKWNGADAELGFLEMTESSENTIRYEFTNQKYPKELSADEKQNFVIE
jgi:hypothetical protein